MFVWQASTWQLTVRGPGSQARIPCFYEWNSGFTGPEGVTAPMVYVGTELEPEHDVEGKIVVAEGRLWGSPRNHWAFPKDHPFSKSQDILWLSVERGAVGIVFITSDPAWPGYNYSELYSPNFDPDIKPIPSLLVSRFDGEQLREVAKRGADATLVLDGTRKPGVVYNVHGILPGRSEENIIITSHSDAGHKGVIEDASGISSVLAQAATWSRVPAEERPKTLVFVATASHFYHCLSRGSAAFARAHANDLMADNVAVINLEHLAAKSYQPVGESLGPTGTMERLMVNYNGGDALVERLHEVLEAHPPVPFYYTMKGGPRSDIGGYVQVMGDDLPYVNMQSSPIYLLTEHDTMDKIDPEWLHKVNVTVAHLIEELMPLDRSSLAGK